MEDISGPIPQGPVLNVNRDALPSGTSSRRPAAPSAVPVCAVKDVGVIELFRVDSTRRFTSGNDPL